MTMGWKAKRSAVFLLVAVASMPLALMWRTPARGADIGGDCCADLEDRVAELEAMTPPKGNQKFSVTIYGKVNKAVLLWDDDHEKSTYVVDNYYSASRFGFKGSAKIGGDWSAGYQLEAESRKASSEKVSQFDDDNRNDPLGDLHVRQSNMYLDNKVWGQLRWGLTNTPSYTITQDTNVSDLEDTMNSDDRMNRSFFLRPKGFNNAEGLSKLKWSDISRCYNSANAFMCSGRRNGFAYWSPDWAGFSVSVGYFEDYDWSAAARYKKQWAETWEIGAGIGFEELLDERLQNGGGGNAGFRRDLDEWGGSASIKHLPTGLYAFSAFTVSNNYDSNTLGAGVFTGTSDPQMTAWDSQIGVQRKLFASGDSSIFGGFVNIHDGVGAGTFLGSIPPNRLIVADTFANVPINTEITGANVDKWYLGFDQALDSANMHLYAVFEHLTPDVSLVDKNLNHVAAPLDDFTLFYTGARISFRKGLLA
jgi:predicted porin